MFDKARALESWRSSLAVEGELTAEQIAELEDHLVNSTEHLASDSLSDEEKFFIATQRLGHPANLRDEFEKVTPWATWRVPIFWATVGVAWTLGIEAVLEVAVPLGALAARHFNLPFAWLNLWVFVICVGGPIITLASVAAWMRAYSAAHPRSTRALFTTIVVAALLRIGSLPLLSFLNQNVWRGFDVHSWRSFHAAWQAALLVGFFCVACVGGFALVRFRELRVRAVSSR